MVMFAKTAIKICRKRVRKVTNIKIIKQIKEGASQR